MSKPFDIAKNIYSFISYKGIPFPGAWFPWPGAKLPEDREFNPDEATTYDQSSQDTKSGAIIRKHDALGRMYFMPVTFIYNEKEYEVPNAVIGFTGKKNIVETSLVGRKGTVKELISIDDYEISIAGAVVGEDWPEEGLRELMELYETNAALELKCALTDLFMTGDDRVVIKKIDAAQMRGNETLQLIDISCATDRAFELYIE